jgi:hypothetical protein
VRKQARDVTSGGWRRGGSFTLRYDKLSQQRQATAGAPRLQCSLGTCLQCPGSEKSVGRARSADCGGMHAASRTGSAVDRIPSIDGAEHIGCYDDCGSELTGTSFLQPRQHTDRCSTQVFARPCSPDAPAVGRPLDGQPIFLRPPQFLTDSSNADNRFSYNNLQHLDLTGNRCLY